MRSFRDTLEKARFFAQEAATTGPADRVAFRHQLEAAIVFARSVTFHIQKELANQPGFNTWYDSWQAQLRALPLARFFLEQRNYVLKQGPISIGQAARVSINSGIELRASLGLVVIRSQPWYRRSLRILVSDATWPLRERWRQNRVRRAEAVRVHRSVTTDITLHFVEDGFNHAPALTLFGEYLSHLEAVVSDAEARFPEPR